MAELTLLAWPVLGHVGMGFAPCHLPAGGGCSGEGLEPEQELLFQ